MVLTHLRTMHLFLPTIISISWLCLKGQTLAELHGPCATQFLLEGSHRPTTGREAFQDLVFGAVHRSSSFSTDAHRSSFRSIRRLYRKVGVWKRQAHSFWKLKSAIKISQCTNPTFLPRVPLDNSNVNSLVKSEGRSGGGLKAVYDVNIAFTGFCVLP